MINLYERLKIYKEREDPQYNNTYKQLNYHITVFNVLTAYTSNYAEAKNLYEYVHPNIGKHSRHRAISEIDKSWREICKAINDNHHNEKKFNHELIYRMKLFTCGGEYRIMFYPCGNIDDNCDCTMHKDYRNGSNFNSRNCHCACSYCYLCRYATFTINNELFRYCDCNEEKTTCIYYDPPIKENVTKAYKFYRTFADKYYMQNANDSDSETGCFCADCNSSDDSETDSE
jgi:hypothetical protein